MVNNSKSENLKKAAINSVAESIGLSLLNSLDEHLLNPECVEISVNRPGEIWLKLLSDKWEKIDSEKYSDVWAKGISLIIRKMSQQELSARKPILSFQFPPSTEKGYPALRLQIINQPAAKELCISIRKHSNNVFDLDELNKQGVFESSNITDDVLSDDDLELFKLYKERNYFEFLKLAVLTRKNIALSGATGSGKTTISKSLMLAIPSNERLISIEDVDELEFPNHPNHVKLFFPSESAGKSEITSKDLLKACLRLNPDRIMMAELRTGEEAYYYLKNVSSGHPGSITTFHGNNARTGFIKIANLIKESNEGQGYTLSELNETVESLVDFIVQIDRRKITDIYYPAAEKFLANTLE